MIIFSFVADNGTIIGCPERKSLCVDNHCKNGGSCTDHWGTYKCDCSESWGGKDCSYRKYTYIYNFLNYLI